MAGLIKIKFYYYILLLEITDIKNTFITSSNKLFQEFIHKHVGNIEKFEFKIKQNKKP